MFFENSHCYFLRKPSDLASTRGKQESFLDAVFELDKIQEIQEMPWSWSQLEVNFQSTCSNYMSSWNILPAEQSSSDIIQSLKTHFCHEDEYGLLNRLDHATQGLLYFAKTPEIKNKRSSRQQDWLIDKYYLAWVSTSLTPQIIDVPLAHHTNGKKMIAVDNELLSSRRKQKIKWSPLEVRTEIISQDKQWTALIKIHKGQRHQIRAHLAYIWAPIIGEQLYAESNNKQLQLTSIGCIIHDN